MKTSHSFMSMMIVVMGLLLIGLSMARASDTYWKISDGPWSGTGTDNWTAGEPTSSVTAHVDDNGTVRITQSGEQCAGLYLGKTSGVGTGTVVMTGGGLTLSAGTCAYIGYYDNPGTFTQTGGTVTVGAVDNTSNYLYIGYGGTGSGMSTYTLSGGTLNVPYYEYVSRSCGKGHFIQSGTSTHTPKYLEVGHIYTGTYELQSGTLTTYQIILGETGEPDNSGDFIQTGGTCSGDYVFIGYTSKGSYTISGGTLTSAGSMGEIELGLWGNSGTFTVIGDNATINTNYWNHEGTSTAGNVMNFQFNANGISTINVLGSANIGGTLNVTDPNGIAPMDKRFYILTAGSGITGTFSTVNLPNANWSWGIDTTLKVIWVQNGTLYVTDETDNLTTYGSDVSMTGSPQQWSASNFHLQNNLPSGKQATLSFDARIDNQTALNYGPGPANYLQVQANGHTLTGPVPATGILSDLVNKQDEFFTLNAYDFTWYFAGYWRLFYSPDFTVPQPQHKWQLTDPNQAPYHFVFDVTKYINPSSGVVNPIVLSAPNLSGYTVHLRNVQIHVADPLPGLPGPTPPPTGDVPTYVAASGPDNISMNVQLYPGGNITMSIGGNAFTSYTQTSEPSGQWFTTGATGTPSTIEAGSYGTTSWNGTGYQVNRRVDVFTDHIHVADNFTNTGASLVGVILMNYLNLPTIAGSNMNVRLGGLPACGPNWTADWSPNPTAIACWTDNVSDNATLAIGLAAEDDIFRTQNMSFCEAATSIGLYDFQLGIDVGASHTLEWDIYPAPNGDYWSVINAIRRNWGSNYAIPGPIAFEWPDNATSQTYDNATYLANWMNQRGVKWAISNQGVAVTPSEIAACGGNSNPNHYADSTALPLAVTWCQGVSNWADEVHSQVSGGKVLSYFHAQRCTETAAFSTPPTVYVNSQIFDPNGNRYYAQNTDANPVYIFQATLSNSYGTALYNVINGSTGQLFTSYNFDGIFNDEFSYTPNGFYSYYSNASNWDWWDNCTVNIDQSTHALINTSGTPGGKMSHASLVQQPWKLNMLQSLINNNRPVVGNVGYMLTRSLQNLHIPLDRETLEAYAAVVDLHLSSPLGLGNRYNGVDHDTNNDVDRSRLVRRLLDFGGLLIPYTWTDVPTGQHYIPLMFPITPTELHAGVVMGTDRIVTHASGKFGWTDGSQANAYVFNGSGQYVDNLTGYDNASVSTIDNGTGGSLTEVRLAGDHFAVLLRKSPTVSLTSPNNGTVYTTVPATIPLAATASDADGTITKVEFYNGANLLYTDNTSPYSYSWDNVSAGSYTLTAKAYDNDSLSTTSTAVSVRVNAAPTSSITAPAQDNTSTAPATVNITDNATDSDGTITKVEFYNNGTLLGTDNDSSGGWTYSWTNVAASGDHGISLTAIAYDNDNVSTTSSAITISVTDSALKCYWKLDNSSGTDAGDSSGTGNGGTVSGASWVTGKVLNALSFDGSNDYVQKTSATGLPKASDNQTECFWFYVDSNPTVKKTGLAVTGSSSAVNIGFVSSSGMKFGVWKYNGTVLVKATMPAAGAWHHAAYVKKGSTNYLYLDGSEANNSTTSTNSSTATTINAGRTGGGSDYWPGKLDEIRIYNRALTSTEISALAQGKQ